jgi:sulfur relay (sulfurtransferase) complex TusBCD TusD component (DsrE family)
MGYLHIILCLSPFHNELVEHAIKIAEVAFDKGHTVSMFLYMDGVYNMMLSQDGTPFKMDPISQRLQLLLNKGVKIKACKLCKTLRGISDNNKPSNIESKGTSELDDEFLNSDVVLAFTR